MRGGSGEKVQALGSALRAPSHRREGRSDQNFDGGLSPSGDVVITPQNLNHFSRWGSKTVCDFDSFFASSLITRSFVTNVPMLPSRHCTEMAEMARGHCKR